MRDSLRQHLILACAIAFATTAASPCTIVRGKRPLNSLFVPGAYVFVGVVEGRIGPIEVPGWMGPAWGVVARVTDKVHAPGGLPERIELVPYGLSASCGPRPIGAAEVETHMPVGHRIGVVGTPLPHRYGREEPIVEPPSRLFVDVIWEFVNMTTGKMLSPYQGVSSHEFQWHLDLAQLTRASGVHLRKGIVRKMLFSPWLPQETRCRPFIESHLPEADEGFIQWCIMYHEEVRRAKALEKIRAEHDRLTEQ